MSQQYSYKAMDSRGRLIQGQVTANNINDLESRLERMGLDLIHYKARRSRSKRLGKVTRQELITFCFHMEQLIRAGVPIVESLEDLRDTLPQSRFREVVSSLIEHIQGGENLSEAMAHYPDVFNQVMMSLVLAGEQSGKLNVVFEHLSETLKWQDELVSKTKKLLMYPAFMGIAIFLVTFFLMVYLVPELIQFFDSMGVELPTHTKMLVIISNFFVDYWYVVLGMPFVVITVLKLLLHFSYRVRFIFDRIKLKVWVIGPILEKIILARFATFFALLYASGITVLDSLRLSQKMANNLVIEAALQQVIDQIADGVGITESFKRVRLFPPLVLRMVKIGEATGELDKSLSNVSYFYDREVKEGIDKIQAMVEPTMTVIMGLLLGWIMMSVLGPLYDMISDIQI
ncbi:type II secretion system F family protein [Candidatus Albibeggiatoa sp. nov. NOAA]|uniref:type II secretion system F family protein n=1 Tax=Candidatus Albibeggiatoa sp. nov. NOAA TaxID=3162724 RepID=UPI0032FA6676|nr:type II secretion system F family protein [Thiotrichaceae bacterium]